MKKNLSKFFGMFQGLDTNLGPSEYKPKEIIDTSEVLPLLNEIFAVDPATGMPKGDIQYFLSKDGNPQVKSFIESCLIAPRNPQGMYDPKVVTDDMIVEFSRQSGESVHDYSQRVRGLLDSATEELNRINSITTSER